MKREHQNPQNASGRVEVSQERAYKTLDYLGEKQ